jgi:hypothetical protein
MFESLGGNIDQIETAYDIETSDFRSMFESNRTLLFQQHKDAPLIFKSKQHEQLEDHPLRSEYLSHLNRKYKGYPAGVEHNKTSILPLIHGTDESIAWKIARGGFGIVSSVDPGIFGRGIYFTSVSSYAMLYAKYSANPSLVIALVNPGNSYPVTEDPDHQKRSLKGKACQVGYQSHYSVVSGGVPTKQVTLTSKDEMVVFEKAQALPKYIIVLKKYQPTRGRQEEDKEEDGDNEEKETKDENEEDAQNGVPIDGKDEVIEQLRKENEELKKKNEQLEKLIKVGGGSGNEVCFFGFSFLFFLLSLNCLFLTTISCWSIFLVVCVIDCSEVEHR